MLFSFVATILPIRSFIPRIDALILCLSPRGSGTVRFSRGSSSRRGGEDSFAPPNLLVTCGSEKSRFSWGLTPYTLVSSPTSSVMIRSVLVEKREGALRSCSRRRTHWREVGTMGLGVSRKGDTVVSPLKERSDGQMGEIWLKGMLQAEGMRQARLSFYSILSHAA